jgi:mycothiol synthase
VLRDFSGDDVARVRALADAFESATGIVPLGDDAWTGMHTMAGRDRGVFDESGEAYAHLARHHDDEWSVELVARPGASVDLDRLLRDALGVMAIEGGGHVTYWVHGAETDPDADARAAAAGFAVERDLLQMRVPLPLPDVVLDAAHWPDGTTVRSFRIGEDEAAWVPVNNRAFAGHPEQGAWTVEMLQAREQEDWFDPDGFVLAFDADSEGGRLAGFCWTKVHPAQPPREPDALGEIYVIGADPGRHGRGLGRALTTAGLESLAGRGITVGMLYVDADNVAAVGLYRALGFVTHRTDRAYGREIGPSS